MQIGLAIDLPTLDELFLLQALLDKGLKPKLLYPYYQAIGPAEPGYPDVVINRMQNRYRRLRFSEYLTAKGVRCFNPYSVESLCRAKPSMKKAFDSARVRSPDWLLTEYPLGILENNKIGWNRDYTESLSRTVEDRIGYPVVVKPTESSRGSSIFLLRNRDEFVELFSSQAGKMQYEVPESLYFSPMNPEGILVEQFIPNPFDLRCIVSIKNFAEM